jgi:hypothetical protein
MKNWETFLPKSGRILACRPRQNWRELVARNKIRIVLDKNRGGRKTPGTAPS